MDKTDIKEYPLPAMCSNGAEITGLNEQARGLFPAWREGSGLPEQLYVPEDAGTWEGSVVLEGRSYQVRCSREGERQLYTFQPQEQRALTEGQLDGALYQVRALMGEFYRQLAPCVAAEDTALGAGDKERFSKSYYQMLRLMDHLDFMRDAADGQIHPALESVELNELFGHLAGECDGLLRETGVRVRFESCPALLFAKVDRGLLRDALLELVSNCAKRLGQGGEITLRLSKRGGRALLCVTDDGAAATQRQRLAMTARGTVPMIPTAGAGAGLGLSVAQEILRLHGGGLLVGFDGGAPKVYLTLPLGGGGNITLKTPRMERNAGMSPYAVGLADVLPGSVIREDWKEE